jgi:tetratricopeptide (TPR) repeat protein
MARTPPKKPAPRAKPIPGSHWIVAALLIALTFAVFGQVAHHSFLNYDDGQFIYENSAVSRGLTGPTIEWALTSTNLGWYPLTWLSHELDVTLWGVKPGPHLLVNVAIHAVNACLLFFALTLLLARATPQPRNPATPAAFIAALFAVHPMHVESVAWISERKDTLSTFFILIALLLYARAPHRRFGVAMAMAASLGAKQMYVTFPFLLLLLDVWPLGRLRSLADLKPRLLEKLPLFGMSIAGSVLAMVGQNNLKAVQSGLSLADRLGNAAIAYCRYLGKLVWPLDLAVPYPLVTLGIAQVLGATLLLLAITAITITLRKRAPYLAVGWFWFLGTLIPVIGIVALGAQSMADRYSYFSYIGLFIATTFAALSLPIPRKALAAGGVVIVLLFAGIAFQQTGYWRNSETLFAHTIAVTPPNAVAEYSLGQALELTKPDAAVAHLRRALQVGVRAAVESQSAPPDWFTQAHVGLGTALLMKARNEASDRARIALVREAQHNLQDALVIDPNAPHARNNLAFAQALLDQAAAGVPQRNEYDAAFERGVALLNRGDGNGAVAAFRQALDLQPRSLDAHIYLALGLMRTQHGREAAAALREAKALDARQANETLTKTLRMPPGPDNLDIVITQVSQ